MKITLAEIQTAIGEHRNEQTRLLCKIILLEQDNAALRVHNERLRDSRTIYQKLEGARDLLIEWGWGITVSKPTPKGKCRRCRNFLDVLDGNACCTNGSCPDYKWPQV